MRSTRHRIAAAGALAVLAICFAAGCGKSEPSSDGQPAADAGDPVAPKPGAKGVIGVSVLTLDNPFFKVIGDHIAAEAAKHGYDTMVVSGNSDVDTQRKQVEDFIVRRCAAIVLCPCDSKSIGPVIQKANQAGIPVFTTDIKCLAEGVDIVCHVATDNLGGGREAGKAMIEAVGATGGEIVVIDCKQIESCLLRVQGFKEVIDAHNKTAANKIEIVAELPGNAARNEGYKAAEDALQAHPDIVGIFAINDPSALGAHSALEKAGRADQVKLIAFDGQPEGKLAIRDGKIYADPIQFPDRLGVETVRVMMSYFRGDDVPEEILIPTELYRQADALADPDLK